MPKIRIHISGDSGAGKSAVAQQISNLLTASGFRVSMQGQITIRDPEHLAQAVSNVQGTEITIVEAPVLKLQAEFTQNLVTAKGQEIENQIVKSLSRDLLSPEDGMPV